MTSIQKSVREASSEAAGEVSSERSAITDVESSHSLKSLWQALGDATRGKEHDYTQGSIRRAIFLLAVPMVLEMVMESLFAVSDVFFVSKLGAAAIATVGLTESLMIVMYTLAMGLAISATAVVARRIGERDTEGAGRAAVQGILLGLIVSATLSILGAVFARQLLVAMGASPDVLSTGTAFATIMMGGSATAFMLFVINAVFRGAGDAAVAMRVLWLANGINIVLGPMLIFGVGPFPELGVKGAAIATTIGRGVGVVFALTRLAKGSGHLSIKRQHLSIELSTMWSMLKMSVNGTFQVLVGSLSWIVLIRLMATFGSIAMAGYTIAIRLVIFALMPAAGLGNAAATMVGQSLGAENPDRAEKAVWTATRYNVVFLSLLGAVFLIFAPLIVSAFTGDAEVARVAVRGLRVITIGFPLFALGMSLEQAFNGAGDITTPTWMNIAVFWAFELPLAWALGEYTSLGWQSIFISVLAAYSALALLSLILFRRGGWRLKKV
ncbi:MAG: MATE family efflux transporter [Gemmatimonadaceae bacterium]